VDIDDVKKDATIFHNIRDVKICIFRRPDMKWNNSVNKYYQASSKDVRVLTIFVLYVTTYESLAPGRTETLLERGRACDVCASSFCVSEKLAYSSPFFFRRARVSPSRFYVPNERKFSPHIFRN
jgi:hypothetical protein